MVSVDLVQDHPLRRHLRTCVETINMLPVVVGGALLQQQQNSYTPSLSKYIMNSNNIKSVLLYLYKLLYPYTLSRNNYYCFALIT